MSDLAVSSNQAVIARSLPRPALGRLIWLSLPGGLVAAALDAAFAVVAYVLVMHRYSFVGALQYIASGLLGRSAFDGGLATAGLGVVIHLGLALGFAALYVLAAHGVPRLRRGDAAVPGLVYGLVVGSVMYFLIVPLSGAPKSHDGALFVVAFLLDHALCVGLPIAMFANARMRRGRAG